MKAVFAAENATRKFIKRLDYDDDHHHQWSCCIKICKKLESMRRRHRNHFRIQPKPYTFLKGEKEVLFYPEPMRLLWSNFLNSFIQICCCISWILYNHGLYLCLWFGGREEMMQRVRSFRCEVMHSLREYEFGEACSHDQANCAKCFM